MKNKEDCFLFDISEYEDDILYQVRLFDINDESDCGEIIATFTDMHLCAIMKYATLPDGTFLGIVEYSRKKGILNTIDIYHQTFWGVNFKLNKKTRK